MAGLPYNKRPDDVFISYSHVDAVQVSAIAEWLEKIAGLKVWWDRNRLIAGDRLASALPQGLCNSKASLFCVSSNWIESTWCEDEYNAALQERRKDRRYRVVALHLDNCQVPTFLSNALYLDLRTFEPDTATALLKALVPEPPLWTHGDRDVYLSRSWHPGDAATSNIVCSSLTDNYGFRLIGDSPDYPDFGENRIKHIISSCGAFVAILPFRDDEANGFTSKWIVEEIELAYEIGIPYLLFRAEGVKLNPTLIDKAIGRRVFAIPQTSEDILLSDALRRLEDEYKPPSRTAHSFFATSLRNNPKNTDQLSLLIEQVTGMQCMLGQNLRGPQAQQAQTEIIRLIRKAEFVLADITANPLNTLIEAGVALGAGTHLHIICKKPETGDLKTRFMFQTSDIKWYTNEIERIGYVHQIARMYRRRVYSSFSA